MRALTLEPALPLFDEPLGPAESTYLHFPNAEPGVGTQTPDAQLKLPAQTFPEGNVPLDPVFGAAPKRWHTPCASQKSPS